MFPTPFIEYEVPNPETGQIVDVFMKHEDDNLAGLVWAFEFQHSKITSAAMKERHELFRSDGIQDFWILDKSVFMKFTTAKGATDARLNRF